MAKPLFAVTVMTGFTILLSTAAAEDVALLRRAQEIFQPLPRIWRARNFR